MPPTIRHLADGQVVKVMPLKDNDMAKLLINVQPRHFLFPELKLERGVSHEDILKAVAESPVVKALEGHPGALVRGEVKMESWCF